MARLEIRNIEKTYQASQGKILKGISLTAESGEMTFLLGPSGCGKSTLLRILAGLIEADSGEILLDGKDITHVPPEKRNMPMVFQNYALWPHMDVFDNIAFGLKMLKLGNREIEARVREMLGIVQMQDFLHRSIPSLSGGQQQRIALARALALDPAVLLLDEPLSNLDAKLRDTMRFEIRRICKERKLTAIYVTHDRKEALSMADRISVLDQGRLSQSGTPRQVYLHPENKFCASFLGDINFMEATCTGVSDSAAEFESKIGRWTASTAVFVPETGKNYTLAFRPESAVCEAAQGLPNRFTAQIEKSAFLGESSFRTVRFADTGIELNINEYAAPDRKDGEMLTFAVPADRISILER